VENFDLRGFQLCHVDYKPHNILREKRVVLGLTQKQVSEKAKVVLQQYQKFESGERNIMTCSFQLACRIIEALDMDITAFYRGDYALGERIFDSPEGLRYEKTGRLVEDDVE